MLKSNTPTKGYVYVENLVITYGSQVYAINNLYTKDKYIYWDINDTSNLKTFNVRQSKDNLILIIKNDYGEGYEMEDISVVMTYDGMDKKTLMNKLNSVNKNSQQYKNELDEINNNVSSLSDDLVKNSTFNDIKETFNTSVVQLNNKLVSLNLLIKNNVSDNLLTVGEKGNINYEYGLFEQKILEVLSQSNSLLTLYMSFNSDIDEDTISLVRNNESELSNLVAELNIQIDELVNSQTETITIDDVLGIICNLTTTSNQLVILKENCNNLVYLGVGNTIVDTVNDISYRLETLTNIVDEIQENVTSGYEEEKKNVQDIINIDINITNKINNLLYSALNNNEGELTINQSSTVSTYCNNLKNNINKLISTYEIYYENNVLDEDLKSQFKESMENFKTAQANMIDYLNKNKEDLLFTSKEYEQFIKYLTKHRECRSKISSKFMSVINLVINAQGSSSLDSINNKINDINNTINTINTEINNIKQQLTDFDTRLKVLEG